MNDKENPVWRNRHPSLFLHNAHCKHMRRQRRKSHSPRNPPKIYVRACILFKRRHPRWSWHLRKSQNDRARNYVIAALNSAGINNAMTDYEKILAINNYLCQKLDYAHYATEENFSFKKDWLPFTDYCLLANSALCAGYADAFQSMCCALGIECWYVTGYVNRNNRKDSIYHAWNRVLLEQTKYYIDVCWNDASDNAYFLAKAGWEDHKIDAEHETYKISGQTFPMPSFINAST